MSYTSPAGSAAHFDFALSAPYAGPTGAAANFAFAATAGTQAYASSIGPLGLFGLPAAAQQAGDCYAVPISPSIAWGIPGAFQMFRAQTLGATARFGTPTSPGPQTAQSSGFAVTRFGVPLSMRYGAPANRTRYAYGATGTRLGIPGAMWPQAGTATGVLATAVGVPTIIHAQLPTGFTSTLFGMPAGMARRDPLAAQGFVATAAGAPAVCLTLPSASIPPKARFGLPSASRSNTFATYGINAGGRMGQPCAFARFNYPAAGFAALGALGTPTCTQRHRAGPTFPETRFGKPLLRRITTC